jgi:hypothetical protein
MVEFDATPQASTMDGVIGLSAGPASAYADLAAIVRFSPQGYIDARNGANYQAASQISYDSGTMYHFWLDISVPTRTYSIFVAPAGGGQQAVGIDFAFRSEQSGVASLSNIALYAKTGSHQLCNLAIIPRPSNDTLDHALVVPDLPYTTTQNTSLATSDENDPRPSCWDVGGNVWYRYTATFDGSVRFETTGSDYDTWLAVMAGGGDGGEVGCSDDYNAQSYSLVDLQVTAGTTYNILIGGDDGDGGNLFLSIHPLS